jgi:FlaG/FlaF family flagellin (archaellin)
MKALSSILAGAALALVFTGCGGSSASPASAGASSGPGGSVSLSGGTGGSGGSPHLSGHVDLTGDVSVSGDFSKVPAFSSAKSCDQLSAAKKLYQVPLSESTLQISGHKVVYSTISFKSTGPGTYNVGNDGDLTVDGVEYSPQAGKDIILTIKSDGSGDLALSKLSKKSGSGTVSGSINWTCSMSPGD